MRKLHFVNRIDIENAGDWNCSPLNYYYEYFKSFSIIRHDIDFIDFNEIEKDDIVILGGSGLFDVTYSFNESINKLLDKCDNVIAWSAGFNTHGEQWSNGANFPQIHMERFAMISIRDYNHPSGIEYLPCPSVFALQKASKNTAIFKRKYGVIEHKDLPIKGLPIEDRISNRCSLSEIENYILTSEIIITNSYHCAYWSILLKRKTIVVNKFSTKFDYFKYKPVFISIQENEPIEEIWNILEAAYEEAQIYDMAYEEAVDLNNVFFEKVKRIIIEKQIPANKEYQEIYQLNYEKLWNVQNKLSKIKKIERKTDSLQNAVDELAKKNYQLQVELYSALNGLHDELYSSVNALHDEMYSVVSALHDELYSAMSALHDEMYSAINDLHDELYQAINKLHDELYGNNNSISERLSEHEQIDEEYGNTNVSE